MSAWPVVVHGVVTFAAAGLFMVTAAKLAEREPTALAQQRKWTVSVWLAIGGYFLVGAATSLITVWPGWDLPGYLVARHVATTLLALAFGYLTALLLFIYTGRERIWMPVAGFYAWIWMILHYGTLSVDPVALMRSDGLPEIVYASDGPLSVVAVAVAAFLLFVPPIFALLLYVSLWFKAPDNATRYRVGMGATAMVTAFIALVSSGVFPDEFRSSGGLLRIEGVPLLVEAFLALLAASLAFLTYSPGARARHYIEADQTPVPQGDDP